MHRKPSTVAVGTASELARCTSSAPMPAVLRRLPPKGLARFLLYRIQYPDTGSDQVMSFLHEVRE